MLVSGLKDRLNGQEFWVQLPTEGYRVINTQQRLELFIEQFGDVEIEYSRTNLNNPFVFDVPSFRETRRQYSKWALEQINKDRQRGFSTE